MSTVSPADDRARSQRKRRVLDRVAALRRSAPPEPSEASADAEADEAADTAATEADDVQRLRARMDVLEAAFEGLQDSVDRENRRHRDQIADLQRQLHPGAIARSLSDDARRRGL